MLRILLAFCMLQGAAQGPVPNLPDRDTFLRNVRAHLRGDRLLQSQYTFNLKQTDIQRDKKGTPKKTEVNEYEVFPSLDDEFAYMRHISKDGKPLSPAEIEKQDREQDKKLREREKKLAREGIDEQTRRARKQEEEKRREDRIIDEIFHLYNISMVRRDVIEGFPAILLAFRPNTGYKPLSREAKLLMKLSGRAWFCEGDQQLIRLEVELIDNVSFGLGLLVRLNKGATASFLRRRINDEIWLPAEARFSGNARLLLLKGIRLDTTSEFSNYKKFTVETSIRYGVEKAP